MSRCFELNRKRKLAAPDCRQQLLARLNRTFGPAMLLRLEAVHVHRQLGGSDHIRKVNEFPARELGAIAKVEILAQRVRLPASALLDARTSPETGSPIEIEKPPATAARGLLKQEVPVQKDRLHPRQQRIPTIQMPPAGLDHSYFWISEKVDGTF